MKNLFITFLLFVLCVFSAFSQDAAHSRGAFVKRIEFNYSQKAHKSDPNIPDVHILHGKKELEKLFFGDFNAPVEFFYFPSGEGPPGFLDHSAFRILKDTLNKSDILEVRYISNYREVHEGLSEKYPVKPDYGNGNHNWEMIKIKQVESLKLYKIDSCRVPVSAYFAEIFYGKMVSLINNFKAKGAQVVVLDGYEVVFRTVVEDEMWTLEILVPRGDAGKMADICIQIISDVKDGGGNKFDESKYIALLNF